MNKKSFIIILVLSVVVTFGMAIVEGSINNHFLGFGGFPFRFAVGSFLGGSTDNLMLFFDIIFWFVILFGIWTLIKKLSSK